ncbi:Tumbleweed [Operophtera brumata]|uniref:Tumbleweed n=1 Tax=Operophtera brumata TaxID=104452 RepID=A0A0L7KYW2_OPEBR|nr:Tumbleweed [Operophtera brumata]
MNSENSDCGPSLVLSLVAQCDDLNRLNSVLNDGAAEDCFLAFIKQMEWVRGQWASAEAEAVRLQSELDEALRTLSKWEAKFAHVRKLLDGEKRERNIVLKKYSELSKLLDMARDLLFNDNRAKLNDETLQKLAFLNGTAHQDHNAKLSGMSYSRSEDDLDLSLASSRRSWVQRGAWQAREPQPAAKKRRSSTNSSATKSDTPARVAPQRTPSVISAAYGASPRARPRQHNFVAKNFYKRETCGPCGKTCETCRAQAHPECRALLPLPCVPPGAAHAKRPNAPQEGCISEWAPRTPPMVPALLVHCVNEVEKRGLLERGLYRVSGAEKDVKRLKERFLRGCGSPSLTGEDIHVVCGCIKDFLRSLREPLVSSALWQDFMAAASVREQSDAIAAVVQAVSQLPPPNRDNYPERKETTSNNLAVGYK